MEKFKRAIFSLFAITLLTVPLAGCGNDESENDGGKEENGVHQPEGHIDDEPSEEELEKKEK
ncbi:hypothetical protein QI294_12030 [Staphylococcus saprophyticus]|uniref:hypothetical protein n=1 Tax=Staphylococcus sp. GFQ9D221P TaxID=2804440 RepID=UPI00194FDDBE|nr:hypothetical protein [Staphylococcus sp. GFQ9D221P]MDN0189214.1 hypothetical protein [Staphylococcus arlettae]MDN0189300.1 hypothetical protein [Staphylococcus arlettae]MDW4003482.1 hypothetical protein [Staphylococcus saprophyticus]